MIRLAVRAAKMHDVFEIGLRSYVPLAEVVFLLSQFFGIDARCIVSEDAYWSEAWEGKARVGVTVSTSSAGLRTNMSGCSYFSIDDMMLTRLAKEAARKFNSEAVIGDYRKSGIEARGRFLSYFPDGSVWESVDASHGLIDDVKVLYLIEEHGRPL